MKSLQRRQFAPAVGLGSIEVGANGMVANLYALVIPLAALQAFLLLYALFFTFYVAAEIGLLLLLLMFLGHEKSS